MLPIEIREKKLRRRLHRVGVGVEIRALFRDWGEKMQNKNYAMKKLVGTKYVIQS